MEMIDDADAATVVRPAMSVVDLAAAGDARTSLRDQIARQSLSARRGYHAYADAMGMTQAERDADPVGEAIQRLDYDEALALLDSQDLSPAPLRKGMSA